MTYKLFKNILINLCFSKYGNLNKQYKLLIIKVFDMQLADITESHALFGKFLNTQVLLKYECSITNEIYSNVIKVFHQKLHKTLDEIIQNSTFNT